MREPFVNKVAESGIISINPEEFYPREQMVVFDLADYLFMGMILKEKEFREKLKETDWTAYSGKYAALTCSADAIIPVWAWMLAATYLEPQVKDMMMGNANDLLRHLFLKNINSISLAGYKDQRVVIKGCGETPIPDYVYMELTKKLKPVVKSIMYGEPCSTVPVYKKK